MQDGPINNAVDPDPLSSDRVGPASAGPVAGQIVRRHRLSTRIWHWVNALTLFIMLTSGLMIFNAHPRLYWGQYGANFDQPWLQIGATEAGKGVLKIGSLTIPTTGVLGVWWNPQGGMQQHAFPWWMTLPAQYNLSGARAWHLAFAWVLAFGLLAYLIVSLVNGHLRRDVHITAREWVPANIWHDITEHVRLRFPAGAAALRYNVLQKLAYAGVLFGLLPGVILTGLAMSPAMDAAWPWLTTIFGGRQSARSIHFLCAGGLVVFLVVHVVMVLLAGPANEMRSMITGWFRLPEEPER